MRTTKVKFKMLNLIILLLTLSSLTQSYRQSTTFNLQINSSQTINQIAYTSMNTLIIQSDSYIRHLNGSTSNNFNQTIFAYPIKDDTEVVQTQSKEFVYNENYLFYPYYQQNSASNYKSSPVRNNNIVKSLSLRPNFKSFVDSQYFYTSFTLTGQFSRILLNTSQIILSKTPSPALFDFRSQFFKGVSFLPKSQNYLYFTHSDKLYIFDQESLDKPLGNIPFDQEISYIVSAYRQNNNQFLFLRFDSMIRQVNVKHQIGNFPIFQIDNIFPGNLDQIHYVGNQKYYSYTKDCQIQFWDYSKSLPFIKSIQTTKLYEHLTQNFDENLLLLKSENLYQIATIDSNLNFVLTSSFTSQVQFRQIVFHNENQFLLRVGLNPATNQSTLTTFDINKNQTVGSQVIGVQSVGISAISNLTTFLTIQNFQSRSQNQISFEIHLRQIEANGNIIDLTSLTVTYLNYNLNNSDSSNGFINQRIFYLDQNFLITSLKLINLETNQQEILLQKYLITQTSPENITISIYKQSMILDNGCIGVNYNLQYLLAFYDKHVEVYDEYFTILNKIYFPKQQNYQLKSHRSKNNLLWLNFLEVNFMTFYTQVYDLQNLVFRGSFQTTQQSQMMFFANRQLYIRFQSNLTVNFYSTLVLPINHVYKIPNCQQGLFKTFKFMSLTPVYQNQAFFGIFFTYTDDWTNQLISLQCLNQSQFCSVIGQSQLQWSNICTATEIKKISLSKNNSVKNETQYTDFFITYQICNTSRTQVQVKYDVGRTNQQIGNVFYKGTFILNGGNNQKLVDVQYAEQIVNEETRKYIIFLSVLNNQITIIYKYDLSYSGIIPTTIQAIGSNSQLTNSYCTVESSKTNFIFTIYSGYNIVSGTFSILKQQQNDQISSISLSPSSKTLSAILSNAKILVVNVQSQDKNLVIDNENVKVKKIQMINDNLLIILSQNGNFQILQTNKIPNIKTFVKSLKALKQAISNVVDFTVNYNKQQIAYFTYLNNNDFKTQVSIISFSSELISSFKLKDSLKHVTYVMLQSQQQQYLTNSDKHNLQQESTNYGELVLLSTSNKIIFQTTNACPNTRTQINNICYCSEGYYSQTNSTDFSNDGGCQQCHFWCKSCQDITSDCLSYNWLIISGLIVGLIILLGLLLIGVIFLYRKKCKKSKEHQLTAFLSNQNYQVKDSIQNIQNKTKSKKDINQSDQDNGIKKSFEQKKLSIKQKYEKTANQAYKKFNEQKQDQDQNKNQHDN